VIESVLVYLCGVTTIATATSISINDCLSIDADGCWVLKVVHNVESVSESASSALSPAGATVLGNVLVLIP